MLSYNRSFNKDQTSYAGQLQLRAGKAQLDWFPLAGGFHISPGVMLYNGNQVTATSSVSGGKNFTLGSTSYISNPANPITGTGQIVFNRAAPMLTFGWGI